MNSKIEHHFERANHFMFITIEENKVLAHKIKDNPRRTREVRAGLFAAHEIAKDKVDAVITRQMAWKTGTLKGTHKRNWDRAGRSGVR